MSKQAERDYPLKVDSTHLYHKPYNDPRTFREFTFVLELFNERIAGGSILDIGCGSGWTTLLLDRAGYQTVGTDISDRMIDIARERNLQESGSAEFHVADMDQFDLGRADFDGALFFDCLHHCPAYPEALQRAAAHLRTGGYLVLMETTLLHRYSPHAHAHSREYGVTELGFTRSQLRQALHQAGFTDITFYFDPGPCYRGFAGFLKACLRVWASYWFYYPQAKNIVIARKR